MIYVDFNGRCGDQFFQYAFARKIQLYLDDKKPIQMNFYNQERWRLKTGNKSFRNDLEFFNIVDSNSFVSETTNIDRFASPKQKRLIKRYVFFKKVAFKTKLSFIAKNWQKKMQKHGLYVDDKYFGFFSYPKKEEDVFLTGYFEDFKFYYGDLELRNNLLKELTPKVDTLPDGDALLTSIKNSNSVCVSMRSWEEISNDNNNFSSRMICKKDYFDNAIEKIKSVVQNPKFIIFSDDVKWAKDIVGLKEDFEFESGTNDICEKITLMRNCKHFILSNSSFSWWMQYLSSFDGKKVVSPNRWYSDNDDHRLVNTEWIVINTK